MAELIRQCALHRTTALASQGDSSLNASRCCSRTTRIPDHAYRLPLQPQFPVPRHIDHLIEASLLRRFRELPEYEVTDLGHLYVEFFRHAQWLLGQTVTKTSKTVFYPLERW